MLAETAWRGAPVAQPQQTRDESPKRHEPSLGGRRPRCRL